MKQIKRGAIVLLCSASALLSGCSSKKVSSAGISVKNDGFVIADFDLVQKEKVHFDVSFGIAVEYEKTTWEEIIDKYNIYYFTLHIFSEQSFNTYSEAKKANKYISEVVTIDVSKYSDVKVKEKSYKEKYTNNGKPYKAFYVETKVDLDATKFDLDGTKTCLAFTSNALDSKRNEIETFGSHTKGNESGISLEYTYSDNTVTFVEEKCTSITYVHIGSKD